MPIIKITQQMINAGGPWEPGWKKVRLTEVKETPSKDKQSVNHCPVFESLEIPGKLTKDYAYTMNTKNMNMYANNAIPLLKALGHTPTEEDLDWSKFYGKELWIEIVPDVFGGNTTYKINGFASGDSVPF